MGAWITSGIPQKDSSSDDVSDLHKSSDVYINGVKVVLYGPAQPAGSTIGDDGNVYSEPVIIPPPDQSDSLSNTPVSPRIILPAVKVGFIQNQVNSYIANPKKYISSQAVTNGVKAAFIGNVDSGPPADGIIPTTASASDIIPFLQQTLDEASRGLWRESGQKGNSSNPNITGIWKNLGIGNSSPWNTDQTPWCMGFVNFALKCSGYKYVQTASAKAIGADPTKWNATQVNVADARPGDIVLWNFSHVNFIYTAGGPGGVGPPFSFVGGNQTPTAGSNNNPDDGDVSVSWKSGWTVQKGQIAGIYRPSKT